MTKDHLELLLQSQPNSPALHFKLGLWYRSRGLNNEASSCIKKALVCSREYSDYSSPDEAFDESQGWLEYGRLMCKERQFEQAEEAFQECLSIGQHINETLIEWGSMLYSTGFSDTAVCSKLLQSATIHSTLSPLMIAQALTALGAYKEACSIFAVYTNEPGFNEANEMLYIFCLIQTKQITEANSLLTRIGMDPDKLLMKSATHGITVTEAAYICGWSLSNRQSLPALSRYDALQTAKSAMILGLVDLGFVLLPSPTTHEMSELIYILYKQGYRDLAEVSMSQLNGLPLHERNQISLDLCFIAAELYYDRGDYAKAALIFETIYKTDTAQSSARFGAASCFLQETKESLNQRQEKQVIGTDLYFKIDQYLTNITLALQIIHMTGWHTVWTLAQQRNHASITSGILLH